MQRALVLMFTAMVCIPAVAFAASPFNGTWQLDPDSLQVPDDKPIVMSLEHGIFAGTEDGAPIRLLADGKDHPVSGHQSFDTVAIDVIDDRSIRETDRQHGKDVITAVSTAAPDGKTLTVDMHNADGSDSTQVFRRVANGAPGANAISGSWQFARVTAASGGEFDTVFKIRDNTVVVSNPRGAFTAILGGKPVPYERSGMPGITVSAQMPAKNVLRVTYHRHGKPDGTSTYEVLPGDRTTRQVDQYPNGKTGTMVYRKLERD